MIDPRSHVQLHTLRHNSDTALQQYLILQEQRESLRQHLLEEPRPLHITTTFPLPGASAEYSSRNSSSSVNSGQSPSTTTSPAMSPTRSSPPRRLLRAAPPHPSMTNHHPPKNLYLPTVFEETAESQSQSAGGSSDDAAAAAENATQLVHVNEGIKRALTELLNCEVVRRDHTMRTWVQTRLMDTERELRSGRRRRSAPDP